MKIIKILAIIFFNLIDKFIHQKRILNYLKNCDFKINTLIDVGAHKGLYSDLLMKHFSIKKTLMFEPQKEIYKYLKKKYKKNKKVFIFNKAVSNKNTIQKFYKNKHDLTSGLTKINKNNFYLKIKARLFGGNIQEMVTNTFNVKSVRLFDSLKKEKIKSVDLIKIDTEGHELNVLKGLNSKIALIKIILIEFHNNDIYLNYSSDDVHKFLIKNNFELKKTIKFPFTKWEDRIYIKRSLPN